MPVEMALLPACSAHTLPRQRRAVGPPLLVSAHINAILVGGSLWLSQWSDDAAAVPDNSTLGDLRKGLLSLVYCKFMCFLS